VRQPDITRARQVLGWEPEVELEEGLRRLLAAAGEAQMLPHLSAPAGIS
jgi:dTDP-glucose 4,6-dehydratase